MANVNSVWSKSVQIYNKETLTSSTKTALKQIMLCMIGNNLYSWTDRLCVVVGLDTSSFEKTPFLAKPYSP